MLQREVSDSTWKETNRRKQPLYQQTVAIDCGTAQQETNCHRKFKKKIIYIQHIVAGKDKGPLQSSNANFQKKKKKIYNNKKENKNNNWAPSKIRLRLGAEVDKN